MKIRVMGHWLGSSSCNDHDSAIDLDYLVASVPVIIRLGVMTAGIWAIDLDHLVVIMMIHRDSGLLTWIIQL